jgi:hypothetical protein
MKELMTTLHDPQSPQQAITLSSDADRHIGPRQLVVSHPTP